jgi:hypothetical protein
MTATKQLPPLWKTFISLWDSLHQRISYKILKEIGKAEPEPLLALKMETWLTND